MENILKKLSISNKNYGSCIGGESWIETEDQGIIESINPSNGQTIASVYKWSESDYEKVITTSSEELNVLDGVNTNLTSTEINYLLNSYHQMSFPLNYIINHSLNKLSIIIKVMSLI